MGWGCSGEGTCQGEGSDVSPSSPTCWSSLSHSLATVCVTRGSQCWAQWGLWEALARPSCRSPLPICPLTFMSLLTWKPPLPHT